MFFLVMLRKWEHKHCGGFSYLTAMVKIQFKLWINLQQILNNSHIYYPINNTLEPLCTLLMNAPSVPNVILRKKTNKLQYSSLTQGHKSGYKPSNTRRE